MKAWCLGILLAAQVGCGSSSHPATDGGIDAAVDPGTDASTECPYPDMDLDGFPDIACGGTDCDDRDAAVHTAAECAARCTDDAHAPTCPCEDPPVPEPCYTGPEGTAGVGACSAGLRRCQGGAWTWCEGEVTPIPEACDYVDQDCDGAVDNGVLSICGNCNANCLELCQGQHCDAPFGEDGATAVELDEDGCLVFGAGLSEGRYEHVWTLMQVGQFREVSYEADLPGAATLEVEMRFGTTLEEMQAAKWTRLGSGPTDPSPFELFIDVNEDSVLALRATLRAPNGEAARLCRLAAEYVGVIFF